MSDFCYLYLRRNSKINGVLNNVKKSVIIFSFKLFCSLLFTLTYNVALFSSSSSKVIITNTTVELTYSRVYSCLWVHMLHGNMKWPVVIRFVIILYSTQHHEQCFNFIEKQANSRNCGPPPGNKFDLEIGQRSKSPHGTNRKGLVTRIMPAKNQCSIINTSEDMSQVKVFVTDRQTEGQTNGRTNEFQCPPLLHNKISNLWMCVILIYFEWKVSIFMAIMKIKIWFPNFHIFHTVVTTRGLMI